MAYRNYREALEARRVELSRVLEEARRAESELRSAATRRTALERELADVEARLKRATAAEQEERLQRGRRRQWALLFALLPPYTSQAAPAPPRDLLLRYTELAQPKPDYARLCVLLDVYEDGLLRCENTCAHVSSSIVVRGSTVYDRLKELVDHAGTSGAHTTIERDPWPRREVELFSYGHGRGAFQDTDWEVVRGLAYSLASACVAY